MAEACRKCRRMTGGVAMAAGAAGVKKTRTLWRKAILQQDSHRAALFARTMSIRETKRSPPLCRIVVAEWLRADPEDGG
jgi:tagatose-1,6-bisphosphate aldolase